MTCSTELLDKIVNLAIDYGKYKFTNPVLAYKSYNELQEAIDKYKAILEEEKLD